MEFTDTRWKILTIILIVLIVSGVTVYLTVLTDQGPERNLDSKETIGYWNGVYHDENIEELQGSKIHEDDIHLVTSRAIARLEVIRDEPMQEDVEVRVRTREEFSEDNPFQLENESYSGWLDTIWFGQLIIPGQIEAADIQEDLRNNNTLAYYLINENTLVLIVSPDSEGYVQIDEQTLVHELTHAMQDQRMGLTNDELHSKESMVRQGQLSLIEGEARLVEAQYRERCGEVWNCPNYRTQFESPDHYMPGYRTTSLSVYEAGEDYMTQRYEQGGWDAVDAAYTEDPPLTMYDIIYPDRDNPTERIVVSDISRAGWNPHPLQGYEGQDSIGPVGISSMVHHYESKYGLDTGIEDPLIYTSALDDDFEYNDSLSEDLRYDGFKPYRTTAEEVGFVWVLVWENPQSADTFTDVYSDVLIQKGGSHVEDPTYTLNADSLSEHIVYEGPSEYQGYFSVARNEEMVVITYAEDQGQLQNIRPARSEPVTVKNYSTAPYNQPEYTIQTGEENAEEVRSTSPLSSYLTIGIVILLAIGYLLFVRTMT